jgi:hypothetical protein
MMPTLLTLLGAGAVLYLLWPALREWREVRRIEAWRKMWQTTCAPNVITGGDGWSKVLQYSCGDEVCRCGGTGKRGLLFE